ncbi:hypothetical protein BDW75DRAFT_206631 [Aspergillus navahoensis]
MAFTYPPYDVKYVKWLTVKNSIRFKRGETLEDQRQRKESLGKGLVYCAVDHEATYMGHRRCSWILLTTTGTAP